MRAEPGSLRRGAFPAYAATSLALFLPFFGWKWAYYGLPIPNTAIAKSA